MNADDYVNLVVNRNKGLFAGQKILISPEVLKAQLRLAFSEGFKEGKDCASKLRSKVDDSLFGRVFGDTFK